MDELERAWLAAERESVTGWDFSRFGGRWASQPLPWDYGAMVRSRLRRDTRLLDMGTGGGEFLLSLNHPGRLTAATENWEPNLRLCRQRLTPLGIDLRRAAADALPFEDGSFDLVINRHDDLSASELFRVLRPGGECLTQQVGRDNNAKISRTLVEGFKSAFPGQTLRQETERFKSAGFEIAASGEAHPRTRFCDVAAVVFYAKTMEWECPGFTVTGSLAGLRELQREADARGFVESREHRYFLLAKKPAAACAGGGFSVK